MTVDVVPVKGCSRCGVSIRRAAQTQRAYVPRRPRDGQITSGYAILSNEGLVESE